MALKSWNNSASKTMQNSGVHEEYEAALGKRQGSEPSCRKVVEDLILQHYGPEMAKEIQVVFGLNKRVGV